MKKGEYYIKLRTYSNKRFIVMGGNGKGEVYLKHAQEMGIPRTEMIFEKRRKDVMLQLVLNIIKDNPKQYRFIEKIEVVDFRGRVLEEEYLHDYTYEEYSKAPIFCNEIYKTDNGSIIFRVGGPDMYKKYDSLLKEKKVALIEELKELMWGGVPMHILPIALKEELNKSFKFIEYKGNGITLHPSDFDYNYAFFTKKRNEKLQRVVDATLKYDYQEISVTKRPYTSVVKKKVEYAKNGYVKDDYYLDVDGKRLIIGNRDIEENSIEYIYVIRLTDNHRKCDYYYSENCNWVTSDEVGLAQFDKEWYTHRHLVIFRNYQSALEFFKNICEYADSTKDYTYAVDCIHIDGLYNQRVNEDIEVFREYEAL